MENFNLCELLLRGTTEFIDKVVCEWLDITAICRLDSSVCNASTRNEFLHLLHQISLNKIPTERLQDRYTFISWAILRQLTVNIFEVDSDAVAHPDLFVKYLRISGSVICSVRFSCLKEEMWTFVPTVALYCYHAQSVYCKNCTLNETFGDYLHKLADLQELCLYDCEGLDNVGFSSIQCPKLVTVSLQDSKLSEGTMNDVLNLSKVVEKFNAIGYEEMLTCTVWTYEHLRSLCLSKTDVDDGTLQFICQRCHKLKKIDVNGCAFLTDSGIGSVVTTVSQLELLWMADNSRYTDTCLRTIATNGRNLENLDVTGCPQLTTDAIISVLQCCPELNSFFLGKPTWSAATLLSIASTLPASIIDLNFEASPSDEVLAVTVKRCPLLERLSINIAGGYSEKEIAALVSGFPHLELLIMPDECTLVNSCLQCVWQVLRPKLKIAKQGGMTPVQLFRPSFYK